MDQERREIVDLEVRHEAGIMESVSADQPKIGLGQRKTRLASARRLSALANRCYGRVFVDTLRITGQLNAVAVYASIFFELDPRGRAC